MATDDIKKIAVFGSYNGSSIGDTAILLGLLSSLQRLYGKHIEIDVFVTNKVGIDLEARGLGIRVNVKEIVILKKNVEAKSFSKKILKAIAKIKGAFEGRPEVDKKVVRSYLKDKELLLIGGGNLIMDLYKAWPPILEDVCRVAKQESIKYIFLGVGASPINTDKGKEIFYNSLKGAAEVVFRDSYSKNYCEEVLGFHDSIVGTDLAFGIDYNRPNISERTRYLSVNVASVYSERWPEKSHIKFERYIYAMVEITKKLAQLFDVRKVVIFNTNYPLDDIGAKAFIKKLVYNPLGLELEYVSERKNVGDILNLCSNSSLTFVTRLHAGILASIAGSNVIAVAYQPKVRDVLLESGVTQVVLEIEKLLDFIPTKANIHNQKPEGFFCGINKVYNVDYMLSSLIG